MKIIRPSVEFITPMDEESAWNTMKRLELIGRTCYKSEDRITDASCIKFLEGIIRRGHESVIEHASVTVKFICDRGVSHEIVRHRIASYSQESTRYCNYGAEKFGENITFIKPCFFDEGSREYERWKESCSDAEDAYFDLLEMGATPQEARSVLPNSLKTEVVMTANIREWRHFFRLRCSKAAHPQMQEVAGLALTGFCIRMPVLFDDVRLEVIGDGQSRNLTES